MKKIKVISIGLAVVLLTVSVAFAKDEVKSHQRGGGGKERVIKELNLTEVQQKQLEANRKAQSQERGKLRAAIGEKQKQLQEALKNPAVTKAAVEPLANEIKSLQAQLIDMRINGIFAVKEILTPEQFAKFQQMTGDHQEKRKGRFQDWRDKKKERRLENS